MTAEPKPALYVGLAGDAPRSPPARISLDGLDRVELGRSDRRRVERRTVDGAQVAAVAFTDPRMSGQHARLTRNGKTWVLEDLGSKNGTWLGSQRVTRKPLIDGDAIVVGHTALVFRAEGGEVGDLEGAPAPVIGGLATMSPELAARYAELAAAAGGDRPIELHGESGAGKEVLARAVHQLSGRSGPFVTASCAMPASLFASELPAQLAAAATGTLFLDDVGELSAASQAVLAAALGDQRIISASQRDLDVEVNAGRFDAALRARLAGLSVGLPPLRQRLEDLGLLVTALLDKLAPGRAVTFSSDAVAALYIHDWPLNVRELERSLGAALGVATERIEVAHLPSSVGDTESMDPDDFAALSAPSNSVVDLGPQLSEQDKALRDALVASIMRHQGNLAAVAREMGKDRTQIRRWMKRFKLTRDDVL